MLNKQPNRDCNLRPQLGYFRRRGCYTTINTYMMEMQVIQNKIYEIRGIKVMLDFDLAEMYQVETKVLKQAVKRNIQRFPVDFMFELTKPEYDFLRSQIVTLENHTLPAGRGKYSKYLPFAFTEQGIAMLSSVLRNETAINVNIRIMRAFVAVRQMLVHFPIDKASTLQQEIRELRQYMEEMFTDQNDINEDTRMQLELINQTLAALQAKHNALQKPRKPIGFKQSKT